MVYCTKCGTENEENSTECSNCGAMMNPPAYRRRDRDWDLEDDCFGGRGKSTFPIIFGVFLILLGASTLFEDIFWWFTWDTMWPLFLIAIGLLIVTNGMQRWR